MVDMKIKTLLILVGAGSYTKAAEILSLTQPAVSHHIRQLEQEYGIKIFYKDKKTLKITPEGAILVKYARRALAIDQNTIQALEDNRLRINHLTIGVTPSAGENMLPQMMAIYCNENPHTHINICTNNINNIYDRLKSYELDLAIVEGNLPDSRFISVLLDTDYLCLIVSPKHRFAGRSSVNLVELKGEKFILRSKNTGTRSLFENYLQGQSETIRNFNVMMEIDNVPTIKELVAQDLGISIIAHSTCREEILEGKLVAVPIQNSRMIREINMVHQPDFSHPEILEDFRAIYNRIHS